MEKTDNKPKFTKGEWLARGKYILAPGKKIIAKCDWADSYNIEDKRFLSEQESEMNAQLISASPDMYKALKFAYETIKNLEKKIPLRNDFNLSTTKGKKAWKEFNSGMCKVENAISKAEGK